MTREDFELLKKLSKKLRKIVDKLKDAISIAAQAPDGMPYQNTGVTSDPTELKAIQHAELCDRYIKVYGMMTDLINKEESKDMRTILKCRYINFMKWEEIAKSMKKSEDALGSFFRRKIK